MMKNIRNKETMLEKFEEEEGMMLMMMMNTRRRG